MTLKFHSLNYEKQSSNKLPQILRGTGVTVKEHNSTDLENLNLIKQIILSKSTLIASCNNSAEIIEMIYELKEIIDSIVNDNENKLETQSL